MWNLPETNLRRSHGCSQRQVWREVDDVLRLCWPRMSVVDEDGCHVGDDRFFGIERGQQDHLIEPGFL